VKEKGEDGWSAEQNMYQFKSEACVEESEEAEDMIHTSTGVFSVGDTEGGGATFNKTFTESQKEGALGRKIGM